MNLLSVYPPPLISYTHDASATIVSKAGDWYAYEEEKLSRFQYAIADFPEKSAVLGLKTLGLNPADIDLLVLTSMNHCDDRADYSLKVEYIKDLLSLRKDIEVTCVPHHLAHSALAVLTSPFKECVFLTMDGGGDDLMGHWGVYQDRTFRIIEQFELSPAILYGYLTCLAGFSLFEEGKVMGLSSYGNVNKQFYDWLKQHFWVERMGAAMKVSDHIKLRWESTFDPQLSNADTFRRHKYFKLAVRFHDEEQSKWIADLSPLEIACTGQRVFEELISEAVQNIVKKTSIRKVALGGGAFQNIVLNGKLRANPEIETHVSVAPHDAGLSLGAGLLELHQRSLQPPAIPVSAYLGPYFSSKEIEDLVISFSLQYDRPVNPNQVVAEAIAEGMVVGWFHGRAEFGARALGARSVLADPRNSEAKSRLNQVLKKRDWFMPYAPSILEEYGAEYFEKFSPSPYMNTGFEVKAGKVHLIPSAIHVDGSCRAHTVNREQNPRYHQLIVEFFALTGIPMILNTSFNRHGVPIISTPRQAIQHLLEGNIDVLAIEEFVVYRKLVPSPESIFDEEYLLGWDQLLFASKLLQRGRIAKAQQIVSKINLPIEVKSERLEIDGQPIWTTREAEQALKTWWDGFVNQQRRRPGSA